MPLFNTHLVDIYQTKKDAAICGVNSYDKPIECDVLVESGVNADFQPASANEQMKEFGSVVQGRYKLYLDKNVEINPSMKFVVNNRAYQVDGLPEERGAFLSTSHTKVYLQYDPTGLNPPNRPIANDILGLYDKIDILPTNGD